MPDENNSSFGPGFALGSAAGATVGKGAMMAVMAATGGAALPLLMVASVLPVIVGALIGGAADVSQSPKDK